MQLEVIAETLQEALASKRPARRQLAKLLAEIRQEIEARDQYWAERQAEEAACAGCASGACEADIPW